MHTSSCWILSAATKKLSVSVVIKHFQLWCTALLGALRSRVFEHYWYCVTKWHSACYALYFSDITSTSYSTKLAAQTACWRHNTRSDNKVRELILDGLFLMNLYQLDKQSTKFTIWKYCKSCVKKLDGNDPNFLPTTHGSCITTMHLFTRHCLWGSF